MDALLSPQEVKARSESLIIAAGGKICDWLPSLDPTTPRECREAARRALAMHGLLHLAFGAPKGAISSWLESNGLGGALCRRERELLAQAVPLSEKERTSVYWYIEALWALVWAGGLIEALPATESVGDSLASLLPDIRSAESADGFFRRFKLRPISDLHPMLDLYYRAHWYTRNGQLCGYATSPFELDVVMERRKTLEWVCDSSVSDWDETPNDT